MSAPQPFLVYRDRIGAPSELSFLRRQYVGFTRLRPIWIGRTLLPDAQAVGGSAMRLGGHGPLGPLRRLLFRHLGQAPRFGVTYLERDRLEPGEEPPAVDADAADSDGLDQPAWPTHTLAPVLHAQFARGGALALPLAHAMGMRIVVTLHGGDVSKRKNWQHTVLSQRWPSLVKEAAAFVCVSQAVADIALSHGAPVDRIVVVPIGVEVPDQPPAAGPRSAHLFVGRFVQKKGIGILADAVRRLRAEGDATPVVCIGDGPLRPELDRLAREVSGITLTGWLSPAAIQPYLASAISLVVPSVVAEDGDAEGLPSVIPEAMAMACPVIGSDQGGIAEAVESGVSGLLVPPGDSAALAAAMHTLGTDQMLRAQMGADAFATVSTDLNAMVQSRKLEDLLLAAANAAPVLP
ncbi:MAG: glycosyltransferase [Acetobacteraceae bacterium]|nr:glycosyltransferase [Pseudomonadota bacterium]